MSSDRWTRSRSFQLIIALYLVATSGAIAVALAIGFDEPLKALVVGYGVSVAFLYVASQIVGNGSTFDAWWSVMPPAFAIWLAVESGSTRSWIVAVCAVLWGLRLTANWAIGWTGLGHEDWRYQMLYEQMPLPRWAVSFTSVHLFPLIVVTLGSTPMVAVATHESAGGSGLNVLDALAVVLAVTGTALEHFADVDLRRFNRVKQPGDVLDRGLWSRCRHPNYLGEMFWWWSLFVFALAADPETWPVVIGAVAMTVMFFTASIPIAEKRSAERRPGWADYVARTPLILPRVGSRKAG